MTAATVVIERDGEFYVFAKFWLPAERIDELQQIDGLPYNLYVQRGILEPSGENVIDYNDAYKFFTELVENYEIYPLKVGYDRYGATYLTQQMDAYGFHMDDVYQGFNLHPVIEEVEGVTYTRTFASIIDDVPLLKKRISTGKPADRNKALKRAFEGAYKLLRTRTDAYQYFIDLQVPATIPTMTTLNTDMVITHAGISATYKHTDA